MYEANNPTKNDTFPGFSLNKKKHHPDKNFLA